jgi:hypothetical protein
MEFYFLNRVTWLVIVVSLAVALAAALIRT